MIKSIRHFGIVTSDIGKSLHFYRDLLGLKIKVDALEEGEFIDAILGLGKVKVRTVKMLTDEGSCLVELLSYQSHSGEKKENNKIFDIGPSHLALTVENLDRTYEELKKEGIRFIASPQISPNGKAKVAFCYDPDNVPIELVEEL